MAIRSCCGSLSLRQGTIGWGIYTIVLGLLNVIGYVVIVTGSTEGSKTPYYVGLGLYVAWVLSAIILLVAVQQKNRYMLLPWLIITAIIVCLELYVVITLFLVIDVVFKSAGTAFTFILAIVMVAINIYAMVIVAAYYHYNMQDY